MNIVMSDMFTIRVLVRIKVKIKTVENLMELQMIKERRRHQLWLLGIKNSCLSQIHRQQILEGCD